MQTTRPATCGRAGQDIDGIHEANDTVSCFNK